MEVFLRSCDNTSRCHEIKTILEDENALRVICIECKNQLVIRKDWRGIPENRQYSKVFKKDILQGNDNLFYKYHPQYLNI